MASSAFRRRDAKKQDPNPYNSRLYKELPSVVEGSAAKEPTGRNPIPKELENQIIHGSSECMQQLPNSSIDLAITSPPYNVSKDYDEDLSLDEYLDFLKNVFSEVHRVLVDGGRFCVNIANLGRKPYIPLSAHIATMLTTECNFLMRGEVVWNKAAAAGTSTAWGSWLSASNPTLRDTHEYILVFSKGGYQKEPRQRKTSTITSEQFMEWTKSVWSFPTASAKKVGHPAPFPIELPYRLVQLYSFLGDAILDPFMGSGTTALAAKRSGRVFVGYEKEQNYIDLSRKRLEQEDAEADKEALLNKGCNAEPKT